MLSPVLLFCNPAFCLAGRNIMVVISYIVLAKCRYKIRVICFILAQVKFFTSLSTFIYSI